MTQVSLQRQSVFWYQSKTHIRLPIKMMGKYCALSLKLWICYRITTLQL